MKSLAVTTLGLFVGGCASGGGDNSEEAFMCAVNPVGCALSQLAPAKPPPDCCTPRPNETFTRWEDHVRDRVDADGLVSSLSYARNVDGQVVPLVGVEPSFSSGKLVTAFYYAPDRFGYLEADAVRLGSHAGVYGFHGHPGIEIPDKHRFEPGARALVVNPFRLGWSYQSFGAWEGSATVGAAFGAVSFGRVTRGPALPGSGSASFTGKLAGFYASPAGEVSMAAADLAVGVDFRTRTLALRSSNTQVTAMATAAAPELDLSGTLRYSAGSSSFSGTLHNAGGTMSGASKGRFYGPAAQELGGVFSVRASAGAESFNGGYGARRQ